MKAIVQVYTVNEITSKSYALSNQPVATTHIKNVYGYSEIIEAAKFELADQLNTDLDYCYSVTIVK